MHNQLQGSGFKDLLLFLIGRRRKAQIIGRSMLPTLHPGDQVLYTPTQAAKVNDIVVAQIGSLRVIKRVAAVHANGSYDLQGDNRAESTDYAGVSAEQIAGVISGRLD